MAYVISFANLKGGVGKTSLTNAIAYEYANEGKKVLVIDYDPQASQTAICNVDTMEVKEGGSLNEHSIAQIFREKTPQPINIYPNFDLVPASIELQTYAESSIAGKELFLSAYLEDINAREKYDYIFIDPPSNAGTLMISTIVACDYIAIPQKITLLDETGTIELLDAMRKQGKLRRESYKVIGIIPMFFDKRRKSHYERMSELKEAIREYEKNVLKPYVEILDEDIFLTPIRDLNIWNRAIEEGIPLREFILQKARTYKDVLVELKALITDLEKNMQQNFVANS